MLKLVTKKSTTIINKGLATLTALTLGLTPYSPLFGYAKAATLTGASVALSDSRPSTSSTYTFEFDNITTSTIKCIKVVLSDAATGGSAPAGINTASVTYEAGSSDYVPDSETWTAAELATGSFKITNATGEIPASATGGTVAVSGITNGSSAETGYFAQFSTYNNVDCSSSAVDTGTGTFIYVTGQAVSATVDATLSFNLAAVNNSQTVNSATTTVTSTDGTIPFGTVTTGALAIAAHDATVTTNAGSGYTLYIRYTQAPTNGSDSIDDASGSNSSPSTMSAGTEGFGYTTDDSTLSVTGDGAARFTDSAPEWAAFTASNAEVAYSGAAVSSETTRLGYALGISGTTPAGLYQSSTVIITATPAY